MRTRGCWWGFALSIFRLGCLLFWSCALFGQTYTISTVAGNGGSTPSGDGGQATAAALGSVTDVVVDSAGNLYIAAGDRIRKVTAAGVISTIAGSGSYSSTGDGGPAIFAGLNSAAGLALDSFGNLYIAERYASHIRKIDPAGIIWTVAGTSSSGYSGDGGSATSAMLNSPLGVAVDSAGNLYIADSGNNVIRKVTAAGVISTIAGVGSSGFSGDGGPALQAQLNNPSSVAVDSAGNLFICDSWNGRIRKVTPQGTITTVLGGGGTLELPGGVSVDSLGNLWIGGGYDYRVRRAAADGTPSIVAGTGSSGFSGDGAWPPAPP